MSGTELGVRDTMVSKTSWFSVTSLLWHLCVDLMRKRGWNMGLENILGLWSEIGLGLCASSVIHL